MSGFRTMPALMVALLMAVSSAHPVQQSHSSAAFEGTIRGKPTRQLVLPAPDRPNHILGLVETEGSYEPAQGSEFLRGATVRTVETWDFVNGSGSDRGYMIFTGGKSTLVATYTGNVKPAENGRSAISGSMRFETGTGELRGITGSAEYTGLAGSQSFELRIKGEFQERTDQ
jgi:hypothetical protein